MSERSAPAAFGVAVASLAAGAYPGVTSVLVTQDGEVRCEWYDTAGGAATLRNTRSVTKTLTGLLVGIAVARGSIRSVDDPVARYVEGAALDETLGTPTIEELLTMSSCLDCDDAVPASPGNEDKLHDSGDWHRFAREIPLRQPCGPRSFRYCTAGTVLLAAAVEAATATPIDELAAASVFRPLGIAAWRWFTDGDGRAFPGGGLELATRSLAALGGLYAGTAPRGRDVVDPSWLERSAAPSVAATGPYAYGYLLWLRDYEVDGRVVHARCMLGNGGNKVLALPDERAVVVVTATNYNRPGMHELTDRLVEALLVPGLAAGA